MTFRELAKRASEKAAAAKSVRDAEAAERRRLDDERDGKARMEFERYLAPLIKEVLNDLPREQIDVQDEPSDRPFIPGHKIIIGTDPKGRNPLRIATVTAVYDDGQFIATVTSGNGSEKRLGTSDGSQARKMMLDAVADALSRWFEEEPYAGVQA